MNAPRSHLTVLAGRMLEFLLARGAFPDLPFATPHSSRPFDYPRRVAEVLLARVLGRNPVPPPWRRRSVADWQVFCPGAGPTDRSRRQSPLLLGVVAAWNEGDVIFATVRNLVRQGVDRVFVIDDESDDETRAEASAAGAIVLTHRSSGVYLEAVRAARIRNVIAEQTAATGGDVWWVVADADEFPRGPDGSSIRDLVERLEDWVDVVGSRVLEHLPDPGVEPVPRRHPVRYARLAVPYDSAYCGAGHWKHQLFRVREPDDAFPLPGHHTVGTSDGRRTREAAESLLMHHCPLRGRNRTLRRLSTAAAPGARYDASPDTFTRWRLQQRLTSLDDMYAGNYRCLPNPFAGRRRVGLFPVPWEELASPGERKLPSDQDQVERVGLSGARVFEPPDTLRRDTNEHRRERPAGRVERRGTHA